MAGASGKPLSLTNHPAIYSMIHEGLTRFAFVDGELTAVPAMAESWRFLSPTDIEFTLRPVRGIDGRPYSASDIARDLNRQFANTRNLCGSLGSVSESILSPIHITASSTNTVRLQFSAPVPHLPYSLACPELWPVRFSSTGRPILAGPFHLSASEKDEWVLEPNPFFHSPIDPNTRIVMRNSPSAELRNYFVPSLNAELVDSISTFTQEKEIEYFERPQPEQIFLMIRPNRSGISFRIRKKLLSSFDSAEWTRLVSFDDPTISLIPEFSPSTTLRLETPETAQGLSGVDFPIVLNCPHPLRSLGENIVAQWGRLGIPARLGIGTTHGPISVLSRVTRYADPLHWPVDFGFGPSTGAAIVQFPDLNWLRSIHQKSLKKLVDEGWLRLIGRLATRSARRITANDFRPSPYGGWAIEKPPEKVKEKVKVPGVKVPGTFQDGTFQDRVM